MSEDIVLANGRLIDGSVTDVTITDGHIAAIGPTTVSDNVERIDMGGRLVVPAMAEPHAHLDKAFTADRFPNPTGDLYSAIEVIRSGWHTVTIEDIMARASDAVRRLVASGATAIRTHADLNPDVGLRSVTALLEVRDQHSHLAEIQIVGLCHPLTGPAGADGRQLLEQALDTGIDVVGSCPHIEDDPSVSIDRTLASAADRGLPADLHFDEVLDVSVQNLPELARQVESRGLGGRVTASHCVSHGLLPVAEQRRIGRLLADAGVAVITNPRTNLFLQARGVEEAPPRGLAGVRALLSEGALVAAGADNLQDPFYTIGRSDPLETASLLVSASHLTVDEAWALVSGEARRVLGLPGAIGLGVGTPADIVAIAAGSLREAIADQTPDRIVFHRGRVVARTTVHTWVG